MRRTAGPLLAGFLLALAACATAPPPASVETAAGRVRARDRAIAERTAALLAELEPKVLAIVPGSSRHPLEVWVERELSPPRGARASGVAAFTVTRIRTDTGERSSVIHLPEAAVGDRAILAHELTHARLGADFDTLPDLLVEGMSEYVASVLDPAFLTESAPRHAALAAIAAGARITVGTADASGRVRTSRVRVHFSREWRVEDFLGANLGRTGEPRDWERERVAYAFGYVLVAAIAERRGLGALRDLAADAAGAGRMAVAGDAILAAAGIGPERTLADLVASRLDAAALADVARTIAPSVADLLLDEFSAADAAPTPEAFFARLNPRLAAGPTQLPLGSIPEVVAALRAAWPDR